VTVVERHYVKVLVTWVLVLVALYAFQQAFTTP
jgi:hypothetical protein